MRERALVTGGTMRLALMSNARHTDQVGGLDTSQMAPAPTGQNSDRRTDMNNPQLVAARRMELQGRAMAAEAMLQQAIEKEQTLTGLIVDALDAGQCPARLRTMRSNVRKQQDELQDRLAQTRAELRTLTGSGSDLFSEVPPAPAVLLSGPEGSTAPKSRPQPTIPTPVVNLGGRAVPVSELARGAAPVGGDEGVPAPPSVLLRREGDQ